MTSAMFATRPTEIASPRSFAPSTQRERIVEVVAAVLQVALAQAAVDALGVDLDDERGSAREHAGERLRAAHAAEPGGHASGGPASEPPKCLRPAAMNVS